jgi:hypothetical protein
VTCPLCLSGRVYADAGPSGQTYACAECDGLGWVPAIIDEREAAEAVEELAAVAMGLPVQEERKAA